MEDDRAEVDLGTAADIELEQQAEIVATRQPKKRFVGRRQIAENVSRATADATSTSTDGSIQGEIDCGSVIFVC